MYLVEEGSLPLRADLRSFLSLWELLTLSLWEHLTLLLRVLLTLSRSQSAPLLSCSLSLSDSLPLLAVSFSFPVVRFHGFLLRSSLLVASCACLSCFALPPPTRTPSPAIM
eukprot:324899-Pleurochrysis_carterae.AAC.1